MQRSALLPSSLLTVLSCCMALSACGSATDNTSAAADSPLDGVTTAPTGVGPSDATETPASGDIPALSSPVAMTKIACSTERGRVSAATLVDRCIEVSPATHPPCNAANSCAMIEGEIARSCSLMGDDAASDPACGPDPRSGAAAKAAIERYYSAINAHDLPTAWQVWGPDGSPEQTYDEFKKGYAQTERTNVTVGTPGRVEGAAGSLYVTVPVTIDAQLDNGRKQHFTGSYTLRQVNIEPSQGWHITSAKLKSG